MKNANYDNALTKIGEEKEIQLLVKGLLESIDQLNDLKNNKLLTENKRVLLEVSLWDNVKYYLGKLGRYKAGGKIFGKGKIDQEAGAKIQAIIDKKGNEFIKELHNSIQVENAKDKGEFPNNRDPEIFLNIVLSIATVYDNIVAATKLKPNEKGFLPVDAANNIISDLREYVKKYLDVDVNWVSSIMDSEEEKTDDEKNVLITDSEEELDEDRAADVRTQLQAKAGDEEIDSERMKTLKSWRLPLALMGAGASFGALSWLIEWMFPAEKITTLTPEVVEKLSSEKLGDVKPGEGMTQIMNRLLGSHLSPSSNPQDVVDTLSKLGGGNPQTGVDIITQQGGIFRDPELAHNTLSELVKNPEGHGNTLKDVFQGEWAGTGKNAGDTLVTVDGGTLTQMILKSFVKWTAKTIVKKSAVALFAGPLLKTLGIGLLGAGALVKLFREKGKRQSRAKTLNDLLQSLQYVKGEPVLDETPVKGDEDGSKGKNICNANNLDELNRLLAETKRLSQPLKEINKYQKDPEFRKLFIEAFISSTRPIKINQEPLLQTLKKLKENGLLEYGESSGGSISGSRRKYIKLTYQDLQNFLNSLMKLFAAVYKACKKTSQTFQVIKNFFKQLFSIASQGKGSFSDQKKRDELWRKLTGNFSNFLNQLNKLPDMVKGKVEKTTPKEPEEGRGGEKGVEGTFGGSAPRTKPPQLAHYDRGDNYVLEEITRIKKLMK